MSWIIAFVCSENVFGLPDLEISPQRHLIVSRQAGGWTLGAFVGERLVGFVHHLAAVRGDEIFGYSHMMAVDPAYQNRGVGARLKWSQRARALEEGRSFIKWTWDPMQAAQCPLQPEPAGRHGQQLCREFLRD